MLAGRKNDHFELSGGVFYGYDNYYEPPEMVIYPLFDLGYRFQKPAKSFLFRAKIGTLGIGIGLGYAF